MPGRYAQRLGAAGDRWLRAGGEALPALPILVLLCLASATTLVILGSKLTFFGDDWAILLQRPGLSGDSIFIPHNEHLTALPILIYKALVELAGLDSQIPFRLALVTVLVCLAVLVFVFVRERAGNLLALLAAAVLLFLGPASEDLLWSFQIGLIGSLTAGVGVLLALQVESRVRDTIACLLLIASISFSNLGVPFVLAATAAIILGRRPTRLWVPGVPALLFAIWWLVYGSDAESSLTFTNVSHTPAYVIDSMAAGLAALTGLNATDSYAWGRPLLALSLIGVAVWLWRGGRPRPFLVVVGVAAFSAWVLAGANFKPGREPFASRYQLVWATLLILLAAELFRPVRLRPATLGAISALTLVCIGANLGTLWSGYQLMRDRSALTEADLGALEIGRGHIPPEFGLGEDITRTPYLVNVSAGAYYRERDAHGSPAATPGEIASAGPGVQQSVDNVLAAGYRLALDPVPTPATARGSGCRRLRPAFDASSTEIELAPGVTRITNLGAAPADVAVRRFAPIGMAVGLGTLRPRGSARIDLPADRLSIPWHLVAKGGSPLEACRS
jgi:hypothetical protein